MFGWNVHIINESKHIKQLTFLLPKNVPSSSAYHFVGHLNYSERWIISVNTKIITTKTFYIFSFLPKERIWGRK